MIKPIRRARALKAQKSRSVVKTLPAPTGGWNARDAISDMPETDASAMVNFFPETTDVILRYGSTSQGHLGTSAVGNAMLLDGVTGYATTPDTAAISVLGDIDLRSYANLDNWTTASAQFFINKDSSYQFFVLNGRLGALIYPSVGSVQAFLSDAASVLPVSNGSPLYVRFTCDIDNGAGFSVGTFYTGSDGVIYTQLGGTCLQNSFAAIANTTSALELGTGIYPASVVYNNPPLITCDSAKFDGSTTFLHRLALTGAADSKTGIFSIWIRSDAAVFLAQQFGSTNGFVLSDSAGKYRIQRRNSASVAILDLLTVSSYSPGPWIHILSAWDMSTAGARSLYVNDIADLNQLIFTNDTIDYTQSDWSIGASISGGNAFNGCMAEFYFAPGQYLDFSVETNRRKFISASGKPVKLGANGSLPTGTAPIIYLHLDDAEAPADFATNRSTGGNFTITGALTTGSSSPSD